MRSAKFFASVFLLLFVTSVYKGNDNNSNGANRLKIILLLVNLKNLWNDISIYNTLYLSAITARVRPMSFGLIEFTNCVQLVKFK